MDAAAFTEWLKSQGAQVDNVVWPVLFAGVGRGVAAARDLPAKTEIMRIPQSCMVVPENVLPHVKPLLEPVGPDLLEMDEVVLALFILLASAREPTSSGGSHPDAYRAYMQCLPKFDDFCGMLSEWSDVELASLDVPTAIAAAARKQTLLSEFSQVDAALHATVPTSAHTRLLSVWNWRSYRWARYCVQSRAFIYGLEMDDLFMCEGTIGMLPQAMVPLGDMFNHTAASGPQSLSAAGMRSQTRRLCEADWVKSKPSSAGDGGFYTLRTVETCKAGDELCISYGDRNAQDLLENYGFLLPHDPTSFNSLSAPLNLLNSIITPFGDETTLLAEYQSNVFVHRILAELKSVVVAPSAVCRRAQQHVLMSLGRPDSLELTDSDQPDSDTLVVLRTLALNDTDLLVLANRGSRDVYTDLNNVPRRVLDNLAAEHLEKPLSRENELLGLRLLLGVSLMVLSLTAAASSIDLASVTLAYGWDSVIAQVTALAARLQEDYHALCAAEPSLHSEEGTEGKAADLDAPLWGRNDEIVGTWSQSDGAAMLRSKLGLLYEHGRLKIITSQLEYVRRMFAVAFPGSGTSRADDNAVYIR